MLLALGLCLVNFSIELCALYKSHPSPLPVEIVKSEGFRTFWTTILAHNFLWKCCSDTLQALLKITAAYFKGIPLSWVSSSLQDSFLVFIKTLKKIFWLYSVLIELKITVQLNWKDNFQFILFTRRTYETSKKIAA